uniref:Uncharacterized protein n=1 Tax=Enhygromyxa salina TaxID=215803 RepID=A0A109ZX70_9BACT|nr:hypothetical protein [Enhygromyxa salina]
MIAAVGTDTASLDHGPAHDFAVHRTLAAADIPESCRRLEPI